MCGVRSPPMLPTKVIGRCWFFRIKRKTVATDPFPMNLAPQAPTAPLTAGTPFPAGAETPAREPTGLQHQPFFEDKNRAFWMLQSAGWSGYFVLRTLSGIANSQGIAFVLHTLLLTATGYSMTMLMAAAFRRLIRMKPIVTWAISIAILLIASASF